MWFDYFFHLITFFQVARISRLFTYSRHYRHWIDLNVKTKFEKIRTLQ